MSQPIGVPSFVDTGTEALTLFFAVVIPDAVCVMLRGCILQPLVLSVKAGACFKIKSSDFEGIACKLQLQRMHKAL